MPVFFVFGVGLTVISVMWVLTHIVFYGTKRDLLILLAVAWVIVFVLWKAGI